MNEPSQDVRSLAMLSPEERARALERYRILQPCTEDGVPLTHVARHQGTPLRTLHSGLPSTDAMVWPGEPGARAGIEDSHMGYTPNSHRSSRGSPFVNRLPPWRSSTDK